MIKKVERNLVSFTEKSKALSRLDAFLNGRVFLALLAVFIFVVQLMGWDLVGFSTLAVIFFLVNIACRNNRVSFSIICMAIFCVSIKNSPNRNASGFELLGKCEFAIGEASTFYSSEPFIICASACVALVAIALLYRVVCLGNIKRLFSVRSLLWGIIFLCVAFGLSGLNSEGYSKADLIFGLIQAGTFLLVYLYLATTMNKKDFNFDYLANLFITILLFMIGLVALLYLTRFKGFMQFNGAWKACLTPGWGWTLDMGSYIAIGICALIYKIYKGKMVDIWFILIMLSVVALVLTLSRGAILSAGLVIFIGFIAGLCKKRTRVRALVYTLISLLILGGVLLVLNVTDNSQYFVDYFFRSDFKEMDSGRMEIWKQFVELFKQNKIFGAGFSVELVNAEKLENGVFGIYSLLAHNLIVQMFGSCGIVGVVALGIHLLQVCIVCIGKKNGKGFFALAILAFLCMSMLDTIFFKAQFTFVYLGVLLACQLSCEKSEKNTEEKAKEAKL